MVAIGTPAGRRAIGYYFFFSITFGTIFTSTWKQNMFLLNALVLFSSTTIKSF